MLLHAGGRIGWRRVGMVAVAHLFGREWVWTSEGSRAYGVSLQVPPQQALEPAGPRGVLPPH